MFDNFDINNLILLLIAAAQAFTAVMVFLNRKDTKLQAELTKANSENIQKIELATNSMKDALVKRTAEASFAEGATEAREAGEHKAEIVAARKEGEKVSAEAPPTKVDVVSITPVDVKASVPIETIEIEKKDA